MILITVGGCLVKRSKRLLERVVSGIVWLVIRDIELCKFVYKISRSLLIRIKRLLEPCLISLVSYKIIFQIKMLRGN